MQQLKVLFEDNHIIVVEKPVNIPSQEDKTGDIDLLTMVKRIYKRKISKARKCICWISTSLR